jgi:prepilin-type N-terminal cleavage/methylation domain-containing protein
MPTPARSRNPSPRNSPTCTCHLPLATSRPAPALSASKGFTLTEILVVIGIIVVLMSILLPVVSKIRYAAYNADTQNEISQISNACTAYYSTYHAYPGPFSNDDTSGGPTNQTSSGFTTGDGNPTLTSLYFNGGFASVAVDSAATNPWTVTGAENLVVGLMGGLRINPGGTAPGILAFAPAEVGLGPMNLSLTNPSRAQSFLPAGSNYLMWCQLNGNNQNVQTIGAYQSAVAGTFTGTAFTDPAGSAAADCPIPVFVDRFPTPGPLPILYLRARTGAKGIVWDNTGYMMNAYYQYDLRDILPYTDSHIGLPANDTTGMSNTHNLTNVGNFPPAMVVKSNSLAPHPQQTADAGAYFMNSSITPTDQSNPPSSINATGRPRAVDQFILISAGQDGVYGTSDDITSFGSVSQ